MNSHQKQGLLICIAAVTLIGVSLALSSNWGIPRPLTIYTVRWSTEQTTVVTTCKQRRGLACVDYETAPARTWKHSSFPILTRYVVAFLILVLGYGMARFFNVVPDLIAAALGAKKRV